MGWRIGQGIGPRLTYAQRKAQAAGFLLSSHDTDGDEEDSEEAQKHLYPRKDVPVIIVPRKDNFHGLGYSPGLSLNASVGGEKAREGANISGGFGVFHAKLCPTNLFLVAGFGLGALNDRASRCVLKRVSFS